MREIYGSHLGRGPLRIHPPTTSASAPTIDSFAAAAAAADITPICLFCDYLARRPWWLSLRCVLHQPPPRREEVIFMVSAPHLSNSGGFLNARRFHSVALPGLLCSTSHSFEVLQIQVGKMVLTLGCERLWTICVHHERFGGSKPSFLNTRVRFKSFKHRSALKDSFNFGGSKRLTVALPRNREIVVAATWVRMRWQVEAIALVDFITHNNLRDNVAIFIPRDPNSTSA
ncbi:hypothetical protein C8R43DRAFT_963621 [Mycena crocata]|nr:hypothetical protein C8R43DRAFT_963621 [Mycena crocata]